MRASRLATLLLSASMPVLVHAAADLRTADGARYRVERNAHGAVLLGADGPVYLGRDCDAWSRRGGRGRWQWANGGVVVELADARLAFPRQALEIADADRCRG